MGFLSHWYVNKVQTIDIHQERTMFNPTRLIHTHPTPTQQDQLFSQAKARAQQLRRQAIHNGAWHFWQEMAQVLLDTPCPQRGRTPGQALDRSPRHTH